MRKQKGMRLDPSGVLTHDAGARAWRASPRRSETYCFRWKPGAKMRDEESIDGKM